MKTTKQWWRNSKTVRQQQKRWRISTES